MGQVLAKIIARLIGAVSLFIIGLHATDSAVGLSAITLSKEPLFVSVVAIALWVMCEASWSHE